MIFCPRCAGPISQRQLEGKPRDYCTRCDRIYYRNPAPVAACIVERQGRIVLIKRGNEPGLGRWALPAGFVDYDEDIEDAAVRETREETGLIVRLRGLVAVLSYVEPGKNGLLVVYRAEPYAGDLQAGDDAVDAGWFDPAELPDLAFATHLTALDRWQNGRTIAGD